MYPENEKVIKEIVDSIRRLIRSVLLDTEKMSKQFGITGAQGAVLRLLITNGPLSSAELSKRLFVSASNMTGIIDRLENKGLVRRIKKERDRRVYVIHLTDEGREKSLGLPDPIERKFVKKLADMNPDHVRFLSEALGELLSLLNSSESPEVPMGMMTAGQENKNR